MAGLVPIGNFPAATDVTTAASIALDGSHSQQAVDARVEDVAAGIIASDPTVAAAAASAVGTVGDSQYPRVVPQNMVANPKFAVAPDAGSTPVTGNWYDVSGVRSWQDITDGPNGAQKVIRYGGNGQYIRQRITDLVTKNFAGKTVTIRLNARALVNGAAVTCPLRVLVLNASAVTIQDTRIEPISTAWGWYEFQVPLPAGNATITLMIATHPGAPAGSTWAELAEVQMFLTGASVPVAATDAARQAGAPLAWSPNRAYKVGDRVVTSGGDELKCVVAHTSGPMLTWHLPNWVPVAAPTNEQMLLGEAATARGGRIGVGTKAVVAIRFDDWHNAFKTNVLSMLTARGLPAGFASVSDLAINSWSAGTTPAEIVGWNQNGVEIHSHGLDHLDPTPGGVTGPGGLYDQIVNSKTTIESWGVKCAGWMQPGASPRVAGVTPYGTTFTDRTSLYGYAQWLIRNTYPVSETDAWGGTSRPVPHHLFHGAAHITISDGLALAGTMAELERTLAERGAIEMMIHSGNLGSGSNLTLAQLGTVFDWLVARRDEGVLEVLTPSGLFFADRSTNRLDLVKNGSFELTPSQWGGFAAGRTVETTGGRTGANFARIAAAEATLITQTYTPLISRALAGQTFMFEGYARTSAGATSRVTLTGGALNLDLSRAVGTDWTPIRHAFTIPPTVDSLTLGVGRASGGTIDWDDISIRPV
ncbi:polysaccharide deacetylase [Microbacterium sp. HM58-2]|nr:polysaccharide deacetylase [Microbacterium sp. HM58-2]